MSDTAFCTCAREHSVRCRCVSLHANDPGHMLLGCCSRLKQKMSYFHAAARVQADQQLGSAQSVGGWPGGVSGSHGWGWVRAVAWLYGPTMVAAVDKKLKAEEAEASHVPVATVWTGAVQRLR